MFRSDTGHGGPATTFPGYPLRSLSHAPVDLKALVAEVTASVVEELNLKAPSAASASTHLRNPYAAVGQAQRELGEDLLYACPRSIEGPRLARSFQEMTRITRDPSTGVHYRCVGLPMGSSSSPSAAGKGVPSSAVSFTVMGCSRAASS